MLPEIVELVRNRIDVSRKMRRWNRLQKQGPTATLDTKHGRLTIDTRDEVIGRILFERGELEYRLIQQATSDLRAAGKIPAKGKGVLLDIGGNIGLTTTCMLNTGQFEASLSFEPDPNNFGLLQKNFAQNNLTGRATAFQMALSDQDGELDFELSDHNFGDHRVRLAAASAVPQQLHREGDRRVIRVKARRLDQVLEELPPQLVKDIALIWIDVQGHEGHVFAGGTHLLERGVPIVAEFWPYGLTRAGTDCETYCRLIERSYRECWVHREGRFVRYPVSVIRGVWDEFAPEREADVSNLGAKEATVMFTN